MKDYLLSMRDLVVDPPMIVTVPAVASVLPRHPDLPQGIRMS